MLILQADRIAAMLPQIDLLPIIEAGFVAYSEGRAVVPQVGELTFEDPPGDVHIKYGYLRGGAYYVIKIASGFYDNPNRGLPSNNGMMLLFSQETGQTLGLLLDGGLLTEARTGVAGAIAARYCAPDPVTCIGIVGSGNQAHWQLKYLAEVTDCRRVMVLGRTPARVEGFCAEMEGAGYSVDVASGGAELGAACNLIVTTTPAARPWLQASDIRPGTHITAVGADTPHKQELDTAILARADLVVADSITQCLERGEIAHAVRNGSLAAESLVELGDVIAGRAAGRTAPEQVTVVDLTGVAVQDLKIAAAVYEAFA